MSSRLNPTECQSAFEELYKSSPAPIALRSTSFNNGNKSVFISPQPLCHQLISPRPIVTSTSGPRTELKAQVFESLKRPSDAKTGDNVLPEGCNTDNQKHTMTEGGEGHCVVSSHGKHEAGIRTTTPTQPDTSTADVMPALRNSAQNDIAEEDEEEDPIIDNFFSKKMPRDTDSQTEEQGEETCQDADVEDASEMSSSQEEYLPVTRAKRRQDHENSLHQPTKLYEWIIKPMPLSRGICLDGKRDRKVAEYWQTGVVTERLTATMVATSSGSRYQLVGQMDLYEATEAGIPPETAKKFKKGFPASWLHLVKEFFSSLDQEGEDSVVEDDEVDDALCSQPVEPVEPVALTKLKTGKRERDQYYIDSQDSEEEDKQEQEQEKEEGKQEEKMENRRTGFSRTCNTRNKYASKSTTDSEKDTTKKSSSEDIFEPKEDTQIQKKSVQSKVKQSKEKQKQVALPSEEEASSADEAKVVEQRIEDSAKENKVTKLHLWIIKPMQSKLGVCLEGQRDREDEYWHSSVICQRLDQKRVMTSSGSVYQLVGPIQKLDALEAGIPEKIVKAFQNGFPKNWENVLKKYYVDIESASETTETTETTTTSVKNTKKKKSRKKAKKEIPVSEDEDEDPNKTLCTPSGQRVNLEKLPQTRSGRQVMPRLAWWMGQRRSYDVRGNIIEISRGTPHAESHIKKTYSEYKTRSHQCRKYVPANTSSMSTPQRQSSNVQSQVLDIIEKAKSDRTLPKERRETCYDKRTKETRRQSKLDMLPVVPVTLLKENIRNKESKTDVCEKKDKIKQNPAPSRRRILEIRETSSSEEEDLSSNRKSNIQSKSQTFKSKSSKTKVSRKRKSTVSSSESDDVGTKKARRMQKRMDESEEESATSQTKTNKNVSKKKKTISKKGTTKSPTEWGKSEIMRLYRAIERTREEHPYFWDVIAEAVETRTMDECRIYYENSPNTTSKPEPKTKSKPKGKSKKGKAKYTETEDDDFFKATPFRPSNNKKSKTFNLTAEETLTFDEECLPTPGALHKTPIVKDIQSLRMEKALNKSRLARPEEEEDEEEETDAGSKPAASVKTTKSKPQSNAHNIAGVTAGRGTMKRKEQLREVYNKHNKGVEDDIFDATPHKTGIQKKSLPQKFTLTEEEELDFESECLPTPGIRHKTPIVSQGSRFSHKTPTSGVKTVTTPWLNPLNRKMADQVIAQNQRKGGRQNRGKDSKSQTPRARGAEKAGPTKSLFRNDTTLTNLFEEVEEEEEMDEEEKDYYWSDED
ncbi:mis18-binding protein 1-like [Haliotis rufescens]|uniref:mis18-binding protein 1-like n=1 Tax=Haliotis rufescens TaxID=6454 RepID=UPI00201E9384|nr:mis18-binding protein 1-like [Haliotis rufescens]